MSGWGDNKNAASVRDIIKKIAKEEVDLRRPDIKIGTVFSFDRPSQLAQILFPGSDETNLVPVRFALDRIPSQAMKETFETEGYEADGNIVRIGGKPGAYFILDYITGAPISESADLAITKGKVKWEEEVLQIDGPGSFYHDLLHTPLEKSETLHWDQLYQDERVWDRTIRELKIKDTENRLQSSDRLTYRYMYQETDFEEVITYDAMPFRAASSNSGLHTTLPLPDGTLEGDFIVVCLSGNIQPTVSDRRMTGHIHHPYQQSVYWGYQDSTFDAISGIDVGPANPFDWVSSVACSYPGVKLDTAIPYTTFVYGSPLPTVVSNFVIAALNGRNGTVAGNIAEGTGAYQSRVSRSVARESNRIVDWFSKDGPVMSPGGSLVSSGTWFVGSAVVMKMRPS